MARLSIVDSTRLNMGSVTVVIAGGAAMEIDILMQVFTGFGTGRLIRAESVQEVQKAFEYANADLLVVDLSLGSHKAVDIVHWLRRRQGAARFTPVVLVGAHVTSGTMAAVRDAGVHYIISKPVTASVMIERLFWMTKEQRRFIECSSYVGPDRRIRALGPPVGMEGRREGDLSAKVGGASTPNMSQTDIDAMLSASKKAR